MLLAKEMRATTPSLEFDLNLDGNVDLADHLLWTHELKQVWLGDANLDDEFNSSDLIAVFQSAKYELDIDAGWAEGDWTGDRRFGTDDLTAAFQDGGYEDVVPALTSWSCLNRRRSWLIMGSVIAMAIRRRQH